MDSEQAALYELVSAIPRKDGWSGPKYPTFEFKHYRGKTQWVATYGHSRRYSHPMTGLVYDVVIGWGETKAAALERAKDRVAKLKEKS